MRNPIRAVSKWLAGLGRSRKWPEVRAAWLRDHPACAACGSTKDAEVHHKCPFWLYPNLELDPSNFITLCETMGTECHFRVGHLGNWHDYNPNVEKDAALCLEERK